MGGRTLAPTGTARWNVLVRASWYWARAELRRRWRATLLLVVLVGLAGGVCLTMAAGARRSSTAYDRFRDETLAADLDIRRDGPPSANDELRAAVASLPQVEVMAELVHPFLVPAGSGLYPYLDFLVVAGVDDVFTRRVDRPRLLEGRLPAAERVDEIAVFELYAREADLDVGDRIAFESYAPRQFEALFGTGDAGPPAGPRMTLRVTGVLDAPLSLSESLGAFQPRAVLSPAFHARYADDIATYPGGFTVRLARGTADVSSVTNALRRRFADDPALELQPASELDEKIESSIDVVVTALVLCAITAGVASAVAVTQAFARHFTQSGPSRRSLAALGATRRERVTGLLVTAAPVALGGAVVAVIVAVLASPAMPVGVARRAEPDRGFSIEGTVLAIGGVIAAIAVVVLAVLAALAVERSRGAGRGDVERGRSRFLGALQRPSLSPTASMGVGLAVDPRGGTTAAVRAAMVGAALGVTGVVSVAVFAASLSGLLDSPVRYGTPWDGRIPGFGGQPAELAAPLAADRDVAHVGVLTSSVAVVGGSEVNVHAFEGVKGDLAPTLLDGRLPARRGEVALGAKTMRSARSDLGDTIEVAAAGERVRARVVGAVAFPVIDERSSVGRGALLTHADLAVVAPTESLNNDVVFTWREGVDVQDANVALAERDGAEVVPPALPSDVNNLREVEALPRALAAFVACLAALASAHALLATGRARRRDLAVLRTLGFEGGQLTGTIVWQSTTIAVVGVVVGVPLGVAAGRVIWRDAADGIGVVDHSIVPGLVVAGVAVGAVVIACVLATIAARTPRRVRPATVLRAG